MFFKRRLPLLLLIEKTLKVYIHYFFMFFVLHAIYGICASIITKVFPTYFILALFSFIFLFFIAKVCSQLIDDEFYGFLHIITNSYKQYIIPGAIYFVYSVFFFKNYGLFISFGILSFFQVFALIPLLAYTVEDTKFDLAKILNNSVNILKYNFFKVFFSCVFFNITSYYLLIKSIVANSELYSFLISLLFSCVIMPIFIVFNICLYKIQLSLLKK